MLYPEMIVEAQPESEDDSYGADRLNGTETVKNGQTTQEAEQTQLTGSLSDLCKVRVLRNNLIIMAIIWSFGSFAFFLVPFYLSQMKANIYYLSLGTEAAEFLASVICVFIARIMDLRRALFLCCMVRLIPFQECRISRHSWTN